ncbi:MAG TPA: outer membrane protein transport protein [Gammaproteobacteria bacterium]|nr:outer membrane protein transport protein [Gammaproteobacteria bacterium]
MTKNKTNQFKSSPLLPRIFGFTFLTVSSTVFAAGFQIQEQNVTYLGTAYSGTAAWAADASTAFYNSAGLTHIPYKQVVASGVLILANSDFNVTTSNVPAIFGIPVPGQQSDDPGGLIAIPSLYYSAQVGRDWFFGLSVASPFGLKTVYDENAIMRYVATRSELRTIDIAPSLAWRAQPWLSLSAGFDALYAEAQLDVMTNFGAGLPDGDGFQKNRANDWAFGWHAGFLIDFNENSRIGLQYRSKFRVKAEGNSENLSAGGFIPAGTFLTRRVNSSVELPETVVLSGYHAFNKCWAFLADLAWTRWSRFDALRLTYFPPSPPPLPSIDTVTHENFKDVWRVAVGLSYAYNNHLEFRTGLAWDESPVRDQYRTARIPDEDRIWLGFGVGFNVNENLHVDLGYAHLFFKDASLLDRGPSSVVTGLPLLPANLVQGDYDSNANIFGIQIRYNFV